MTKTQWQLDTAHSEVTFSVRHMMISNVSGNVQKFEATVETDGNDPATAVVHFAADVDSITTNNEQRDKHLMSADFFDTENHSQIKFESTRMEKVSDERYKLYGNLTMRGVTKPEVLDVEYGGTIKDPYGMIRAGFSVEGRVNRKDYGLNWSALTETGGLVAGNEVKIRAHVEFTRK